MDSLVVVYLSGQAVVGGIRGPAESHDGITDRSQSLEVRHPVKTFQRYSKKYFLTNPKETSSLRQK